MCYYCCCHLVVFLDWWLQLSLWLFSSKSNDIKVFGFRVHALAFFALWDFPILPHTFCPSNLFSIDLQHILTNTTINPRHIYPGRLSCLLPHLCRRGQKGCFVMLLLTWAFPSMVEVSTTLMCQAIAIAEFVFLGFHSSWISLKMNGELVDDHNLIVIKKNYIQCS